MMSVYMNRGNKLNIFSPSAGASSYVEKDSPKNFSMSNSLPMMITQDLTRLCRRGNISLEDIEQCKPLLTHICSRYNSSEWIGYFDDIIPLNNSQIFIGWVKKVNDIESQFISLAINNLLIYESFLANITRLEVKMAGYGTGEYGFKVDVDPIFMDSTINIAQLIDPATDHVIAIKLFCGH